MTTATCSTCGKPVFPHPYRHPITYASYELKEGHGAGKTYTERVIDVFPTFETARDYAVPDHPDEWVQLDDDTWFHGGGTMPGQSFTITRGRSANPPVPQRTETSNNPNTETN